jgi:hypothetical protein
LLTTRLLVTPRLLLAAAVGLVVLGPTDDAPAASYVARCARFIVYQPPGITYYASHVERASAISCSEADNLLRAAYGGGPLRPTRVLVRRNARGEEYGRPTIWLSRGWRCTNGAGGAACWNVTNQRYNVIRFPYAPGRKSFAVSADVR